MARTVDPERHRARRLRIIDAALTCFARHGYDRASTAAICREAGIGSGTFFHYFPTKQDVLLATLALGTAENEDWFAAQAVRDDAAGVLADFVARTARQYADPRTAGFVSALGSVMGLPEVEAALAADTRGVLDGLRPWIERAQHAGDVRDDLSAAQLARWVLVILDGFLGRAASGDGFEVADEAPVLMDAVARLLAPAQAQPTPGSR